MGAKQSTWIFILFLLFATSGVAQSRRTPPQTIDGTTKPTEADEGRDRIAREMAKKANQERQAAIKNDTDKLVRLAGELRDYVDKTNENMLSVNVMKKAEEIEKLARSVKDKMKGTN